MVYTLVICPTGRSSSSYSSSTNSSFAVHNGFSRIISLTWSKPSVIMLSVSTATVPQAMRPNINNASPSPPTLGRKDRRSWNCEYTFPKRRCRPSAARKKIIANGQEEATIEIDVHCKTVNFQQSEIADSSLDVFGDQNDASLSSPKTPKNLQDSLADKEKAPRPIPFLKSAQMQRVKTSRPRDEDSIENVSENPEKLQKISNTKKSEVIETDNTKDTTIDVVKSNHQDDNCKNISDTQINNIETTENPIIEKLAEETKNTASPLMGSRISHAVEFLMRGSNDNPEDNVNDGAPGIPGEEIVRDAIENFPPILEENGWDSDAEVSMLRNLREDTCANALDDNHERIDNRCFLDEETSVGQEVPYYMIGFPNPPGENRCWLNATLHAMFALPLFDHPEQLDSEQLRGCSQLTKTLMALRLFWSRGDEQKQKTYQTVKLFKESLGILDESYPSQRQQDVSEFLTIFLNYIKTDFEKCSSRIGAPTNLDEKNSENMTENVQETRTVPRSPQTPTKRPPLADISPSKRKINENDDYVGDFSPKLRKVALTYSAQDLLSPRVNRILTKPTDPTYKVHTPPHRPNSAIQRTKDNAEFCKNPIDRYFILHMMEHYCCNGCSKHRQRKVDNLMLYVDLPPGNENRTVMLDDAIKTSLEPEERILTCGKCKYDKHKVYTTFRVCPKILMVQVNRYGMCEDGSVAKFNTPVEIPENLQLELASPDEESGYSVKENFKPVCVIAHVGSAMDCGHYTSYVKHGDDCWYHYNDLMVTPMSRYEALVAAQTTAYVVFFENSKI